ncbi:MerR family transcriptional regulator [Enterococcus faecalis]|uniref:MerR family transcriptional regulator n=1 Tax=Enterococcus faecalis TaxID=1351 RepID=UPI001AD72B2D|nr:MerR family transcriptional regulator [Enterococcus faecalis]MBO6438777.1 MerR family transcriptional regulator [Enterococcus faecalis]MBO6453334.1 MerR family transcriptional regulator [Enterococcus faecalis]
MNISQVAKQLELTPTTLRYYETIGLIPPIERTSSGIRVYCEADIDWIFTIKCMREAGLSIDSLIEYNALYLEGEETYQDRKEILLKERQNLLDKINDIKLTLDRLEYKISKYDKDEKKTYVKTRKIS